MGWIVNGSENRNGRPEAHQSIPRVSSTVLPVTSRVLALMILTWRFRGGFGRSPCGRWRRPDVCVNCTEEMVAMNPKPTLVDLGEKII